MVWLSSMENFSQLFIVFHFPITFLSSIKCQEVVLSTSGWSTPWVEGLSLLVQTVKNLSAMQDFQVRSLGLGDSLEREMATHSSILAWRISRTVEPGGLVHGAAESDMTEQVTLPLSLCSPSSCHAAGEEQMLDKHLFELNLISYVFQALILKWHLLGMLKRFCAHGTLSRTRILDMLPRTKRLCRPCKILAIFATRALKWWYV